MTTRKIPYTSQPQGAASTDSKWDVSAAWNMQSGMDSVSGLPAVTGAGYSKVVTDEGVAAKVSGTSVLNRCALQSSRDAVDIGSDDFTVAILFKADAGGGYSVIGRWNTGGTPATSDWFLGFPNQLGTDIGFVVACGSSQYVASYSSGLSLGVWNLFIGRRRGTTIYVDRYTDGERVGGASTTNAGITTVNYNSARKTKLGEIDVGANYNVQLTSPLAFTAKRFFSDAECLRIAENPWQIFQPQKRPIFVGISAPSGTTITTTVGDAYLSGVSAQIIGSVSISTSPGNSLVSGVSAYLNKSVVSAPSNTLASGVSAYLNRTFVTLPGNAIAHGVTSNLNFSIPAIVGNTLAQGVPATISVSGQVIINTIPGNVLASGVSSNVNVSLITTVANALASGVTAAIGNTFTITTTPGDTIAEGIVASLNQLLSTLPADTIVTGVTATITSVVSTIARPSGDVSVGGWLPSSGSELYPMIDEVLPSDTDYIYATSNTVARMNLSPVGDPGTTSGQVVNYRAWSPSGNGITVNLYQGATLIASWTHSVLPLTPTTYQQALTPAECASITDYANLILETVSI